MGHVESKTRTWSLGQILEKPYVHSRGHIFSLILKKFGQNACYDEISDKNKIGSCGGQKLGHQVKFYKNRVYTLEATFLVLYS